VRITFGHLRNILLCERLAGFGGLGCWLFDLLWRLSSIISDDGRLIDFVCDRWDRQLFGLNSRLLCDLDGSRCLCGGRSGLLLLGRLSSLRCGLGRGGLGGLREHAGPCLLCGNYRVLHGLLRVVNNL
jgi:hypothetical protein